MVYFMIERKWCVFAFYHVCLHVFDVVMNGLVRKIIIGVMRGGGKNIIGLVNLRKVDCEWGGEAVGVLQKLFTLKIITPNNKGLSNLR